MTLVLALANRNDVIQISDRRLTSAGEKLPTGSNKATVLFTADARAAVAFCGLAYIGEFNTQEWLTSALSRVASPEYLVYPLVQRFAQAATHEFSTNPSLKSCSPSAKRVSFMISGYLDGTWPPRCFNIIVTNYQDFQARVDREEAWSEFRVMARLEQYDAPSHVSMLQYIGNYHAFKGEDIVQLRALLEQLKPRDAIVGKCIDLFTEISDRPKAAGLIGKELTVVAIPAKPDVMPTCGFHSSSVEWEYVMPDLVAVDRQGAETVVKGISFAARLVDEPVPVAIPKVRPGHPCPCGGGKKYKNCHGKRRG